MKKVMLGLMAISSAMVLSSCSMGIEKGMTSSPLASKAAKQYKLANGNPITVGFVKPTTAWDCEQITANSWNWSLLQTQGQLNIKGPYAVFTDKALAYANENHIKANYILLRTPDQVNVGMLNVTAFSKADAIYYQCQNINAQ